jgi:hypothetical protein
VTFRQITVGRFAVSITMGLKKPDFPPYGGKESSASGPVQRHPRRRPSGCETLSMALFSVLLAVVCVLFLRSSDGVLNPAAVVPTDEASWHQYVRASSSKTIVPKAVLSQYRKGNVSNPSGLIAGKAITVLSRLTASDTIPEIVVDFGQNTVGILSIEFAGSSNVSEGLPGIRLAFSETLECLGNVSDFSRSYNVSRLVIGRS